MAGKLLFGSADCPTSGCKWQTDGRNAMGLAQQHANRTGHHPHVELTYVMGPNPTSSPTPDTQRGR